MPTARQSRIPSYCRHKPTEQAVVTLNGKDRYLGKWNTSASKDEYNRLTGEWLSAPWLVDHLHQSRNKVACM